MQWQLGLLGTVRVLLEDRKTKEAGVEVAGGRTFRMLTDC